MDNEHLQERLRRGVECGVGRGVDGLLQDLQSAITGVDHNHLLGARRDRPTVPALHNTARYVMLGFKSVCCKVICQEPDVIKIRIRKNRFK